MVLILCSWCVGSSVEMLASYSCVQKYNVSRYRLHMEVGPLGSCCGCVLEQVDFVSVLFINPDVQCVHVLWLLGNVEHLSSAPCSPVISRHDSSCV